MRRDLRSPSFATPGQSRQGGITRAGQVDGNLTPELWDDVARGSVVREDGKDVVFDEVAYAHSDGDATNHGYEIIRVEFDSPQPESADAGGDVVEVQPEVVNLTGFDTQATTIPLAIRIRDFPEWDVPVTLPERYFSDDIRESWQEARQTRIEERKTLLRIRTTALREKVIALGGKVGVELWGAGWIQVEIPTIELSTLLAFLADNPADYEKVVEDWQPGQDQCDPTCTLAQASDWKVGDGRDAVKLGAEAFLDAGYDGWPSSGRLKAGVAESFLLEDESPAFNTNFTSTSRIHGRYDCSSGSCLSVADFLENDSNSGHGTMVSHLLLGDFEDAQANELMYGDSCFSSGDGVNHCDEWERASSGFAPEAALWFFGNTSGSNTRKAAAYETAAANDVDVLNISHGSSSTHCDPTSSGPEEDAVEDAFDAGVFVVGSAGNNNNGGSTSCDVTSPKDIPKAFTVNAFDASTSLCAADYWNCDIDADKHRLGGADLVVNGTTRTGAMSIVDHVAPNKDFYHLDPDGAAGILNESGTSSGTSAAAPHVSGMSLLVREWLLDDGGSWIRNPGRQSAVMLAMADRWRGNDFPKKGADNLWGVGRTKLKLLQSGEGLGPFGWIIRTVSRTSPTNHDFFVRSTPFPSGTEMLKCVMYEREDMSSSSQVSDMWLKVVLRQPVNGECVSSGSIISSTEPGSDASYDLKHMVTGLDASQNLEGTCAEVTVEVWHIDDGSAASSTFCYYAGEVDRHPHL